MRRSFRQFITESGFAASGYGAGKRFGIWGLPSLYAGAASHVHSAPPGGFQSFSQLGQHISNKIRFRDEDYIMQQALQKIAELAENAAVAIQNREKGETEHSGHYEYAHIRGELIVGLKEQDIISGLYPRLKQEDMERGIEMGIIVGPDNSSYKGLYDIKVDVLRRLMEEMEKKSISREFGHQSLQHLAGVADRVTDLTAHGKIPQSHNTNPMGS